MTGGSIHMPPPPLLEINAIWKYYGGTAALRDVSASLQDGEILALMGHNGAGKSTLVKILAGSTRQDSGEIKVGGKALPGGVREARTAGIAVIYQDLSLFSKLTVAENIAGTPTGRLSYSFRAAKRAAAACLERIETNSPLLAFLDRTVDELPLAMRQRVAIARALTYDSRILILDEPTAALSLQDTDHLLTYLRELASGGVGVMFVSHRLSDVRRIADRYLVLRDGAVALSAMPAELSGNALARAMFGEAVENSAAKPDPAAWHRQKSVRQDALTVRNLTRRGEFSSVSVTLRAGEIAVLTGLTGSGRTEFAESLVGLRRFDRGELKLSGKPLTFSGPRNAMRHGLVYVPEDRLHAGLFVRRGTGENLVGATEHLRARFGFLGQEADKALAGISDFGIRCQGPDSTLETLSGGNQQKVLLARWHMAGARVLILDEPTAGVDVSAKAEIHKRLREWAAAGAALLVISSETDEVLDVADRILVFHVGTLVLDGLRTEINREQLIAAMLHGSASAEQMPAQTPGEA
ncbi:MAG TPA: sugar ABC transporter ATP-binding protein [Candidatus Acidoferrum sp.]|nr:sugar ABC transporter ATP-binding protein [Candidatus Acidoferrum sp.]